MTGNSHPLNSDVDDLRPNLNTLHFVESEGKRLRMYLTLGGAMVCEELDSATNLWKFVPLRDATEQEVGEMLSMRHSCEDEEMAREIAGYHA
jgi:hypothetical protein